MPGIPSPGPKNRVLDIFAKTGLSCLANPFVNAALASGKVAYGYENRVDPNCCGEQWDQDLGLYYNRARYLNTDTGRFWSQDSYEGENADPISLHKYLYAGANPVSGADPSGYETTILGLSVAEFAIGTLAAITVVSVMHNAAPINLGGEFADSGNAIGRAISGLATSVVEELLMAARGVLRERLRQAAVVLAAAGSLATRPKIVPMSLTLTPTVTAHIMLVIGGLYQELQRTTISNALRNRADALRGRGSAGPGMSWDEYPFASSEQGGAGASVAPVPLHENLVQGGIIGASYLIENIKPNDFFTVVIVP